MMNNKMEYNINRKVWQPLWGYITDSDAIGGQEMFEGCCEKFENDIFQIIPYSWDERYWNNDYNFWHKPSGFKLSWYKYPLRGALSNMEISDEQFVDILYDCVNSLEEGKQYKVLYDVNNWWSKNIDE
mgnify:CR=1 FL=1